MDRYLHFTWLIVFPIGLLVAELADRYNARRTDEARSMLAPVDVDKFDRLAAAMLRDDQFEEYDRAICAEWNIDWSHNAPSSVPMRAFDPSPHTYPRRPAKHTGVSRNRLHRGF